MSPALCSFCREYVTPPCTSAEEAERLCGVKGREDEHFPLGLPLNRPAPATPKPQRQEVKKGIFIVGGKLQTDLQINGPRRAPEPVDLDLTEGPS